MESHISTVQTVNRFEDRIYEDTSLDEMRNQGAIEIQYTQVIQAIKENQPKSWVLATSDNTCRDYVSVWDRLGLLDGKDATLLTLDIKRLIVPLQARKKILQVLHYSHEGITKINAMARNRYYWPSLKEDCQQMTQLCTVCKELNPKAPINPNIDPDTPITYL